MKRPLALTLGEPAGIGPDITLAAWRERADLSLPPFYLLADPDFIGRRAEKLGLTIPLRVVDPDEALDAFAIALPIVALDNKVTAEPGQPDASSGPAAITSIRRAVADVLTGRAHAIVTNPVAKAVLYRTGFAEPGHTEFLARLAQEHTGRAAHPVMMLWSPELAVVPVTIHLPVRDVPQRLTKALIVETGRIVARDLKECFGIARPRLALAGLNPHAGEEGALGAEDASVVAPAVAQLRADGIDARGPLPADTMFHAAARNTYDAALAMYHDQALIPIKTLAFDHAVNVTLGLPFVRTSPDHGTAFDIAGTGRASFASLVAALKLAARLVRCRRDGAGEMIDGLPPLREAIRRHGLTARKSLGQNFLLDLNLTGRIARAAGPLAGVTVLEVGPGPGGLTRALLAEGAARVIAVERDDRAIAALAEIAAHYPGRLEIVGGDALDFDVAPYLGEGPVRIAANLPYNIATALLVSWLTVEPWPPWYDRLTLMFQREVAQRIVAKPGSKTYGRLSVLAGWRTEAKILFDIAPSAFVPPPKVTSSLVQLAPRSTPLPCDRRKLERVTEAAFGQRRKMLRQSLRQLGVDPIPLIENADLDPAARAEDIAVEGFVALARGLA